MPSNPSFNGDPRIDPGDHDAIYLDAFQEVAERCRGGEFIDEEILRRDYPEHANLLKESLPALLFLAGLSNPSSAKRPAPPILPAPPLTEEFEVISPLGQGGMGVVYEARQRTLGRRVAIKFLPPLAALDEARRRRFQREATAASALTHDHIVPIIALNIDGPTPYYAMKLIDGHSLAEILGELRRPIGSLRVTDDAPDPPATLTELVVKLTQGGLRSGRRSECGSNDLVDSHDPRTPYPLGPSYMDEVARLGREAAAALDHAHKCGVIHGDVKPGNLLIDSTGSLWLADFGVAILHGQDVSRPTSIAGGTSGYMSPEQASPENLPIDHRTDIYSLGATLHELMTLKRPAPSAEPALETSPTPERQVVPSVPRDLQTIVLKAMETEVTRRYASAGELADDLGRFLRREPILARPPSFQYRASTWARRHRRAVSVWGGTVALLLMALLVALAFANQRVNEQRIRAETSLQALRDLLRSTTLAAEDLSEAMPLGSIRMHSFLQNNQRFYEAALARIPGADHDPELRYRVALANYQLARSCYSRTGEANIRDAVGHLDRAIKLLSALPRTHSLGQDFRNNLFRALSLRGTLFAALNDPARAEADGLAALRVIENLARDRPDNLDWRDAVAAQHSSLAHSLLLQPERLQDAEKHARSCREIATELLRHEASKPLYLNNLHRGWSLLGFVLHRSGRLDEAEAAYRKALDVNKEQQQRGPDQTHYPFEHAMTLRAIGKVLRDRGSFAEAGKAFSDSVERVDELRKRYPYQQQYIDAIVTTRAEWAGTLHRAGRTRDAQELRDASLRIIGELDIPEERAATLRAVAQNYIPSPHTPMRSPSPD